MPAEFARISDLGGPKLFCAECSKLDGDSVELEGAHIVAGMPSVPRDLPASTIPVANIPTAIPAMNPSGIHATDGMFSSGIHVIVQSRMPVLDIEPPTGPPSGRTTGEILVSDMQRAEIHAAGIRAVEISATTMPIRESENRREMTGLAEHQMQVQAVTQAVPHVRPIAQVQADQVIAAVAAVAAESADSMHALKRSRGGLGEGGVGPHSLETQIEDQVQI